jgi:hypothetical protein
LLISPVIAQDNPDFRINVINTTKIGEDGVSNQKVFNQAYQDGLKNYVKNHGSCPKNVIG